MLLTPQPTAFPVMVSSAVVSGFPAPNTSAPHVAQPLAPALPVLPPREAAALPDAVPGPPDAVPRPPDVVSRPPDVVPRPPVAVSRPPPHLLDLAAALPKVSLAAQPLPQQPQIPPGLYAALPNYVPGPGLLPKPGLPTPIARPTRPPASAPGAPSSALLSQVSSLLGARPPASAPSGIPPALLMPPSSARPPTSGAPALSSDMEYLLLDVQLQQLVG